MADADCQLYLEEARMYHMLPDHRHEICSTRTAPRKCFPIQRCLVVVGGLTKEDRQNRYSWYLKSEDSTWELLAQLPQPNWKFYSVCVIQNGILVTGGFHNDVKRDTWLFDTVEKKWKFMPPMREGRCKHSSVVHNGNVFVIGGEDVDDCPLESVEQFDLRLRQWSRAPSMPKPLSHPLAVSYGQHIYVMSGIEDGEATSLSMLAFDAIWGDWEYRAEMPRPCRLGAGATVNDHIYVVGGLTRSCMSYSPSSDTWTTLNLPREKHGNAPAVVWKVVTLYTLRHKLTLVLGGRQWRIQGGGGVQGVRTPPLLGHDVGFLTLGPLDPPPFCECPRVGVFFNFSEGE